eukprot:190587-Amphidinium_carterae.3
MVPDGAFEENFAGVETVLCQPGRDQPVRMSFATCGDTEALVSNVVCEEQACGGRGGNATCSSGQDHMG